MEVTIRTATFEDIPALEALIAESVRTLQSSDYSVAQREGALGTVFGVDRQMIGDGTYFAAEAQSKIVGCGGWSRRKTPFGGDHSPAKDDSWLDPERDPARIRAFFIHPAWARRGIASRILEACESAAVAAGFSRLEMVATLTGVPLYQARGFEATERFDVPLDNGAVMPVVRMSRACRRK